MSKVRLRIVWDGPVPGLPERRLSLSAFWPALRELLRSVRRIATDLERDAWPTEKKLRAGRLSKEASTLDLQIEAITSNSPVMVDVAVVESVEPRYPLVNDLGERALSRFLDDLQLEASGTPAHYRVRRFLSQLPKGLTEQKYIEERDDQRIRTVDLGEVHVVEPIAAPYLAEFNGEVVGVGFEPGKTEVKIKVDSHETVTLSASATQVDESLTMRGSLVAATAVVEAGRFRLLRLREADAPLPFDDRAKRLGYVFERWAKVLAELAR